MKTRHDQAGFTLVELIIVLALGALIIAAVFIAVTGAQKSRRDDQRKKDLTMLLAQLTTYQANHGAAPANAAAITTGIFSAKDPREGRRYMIKDQGAPTVGEMQYLADGECRTRPDGTYAIVAATKGFAVSVGFESGNNFCLDADNADNITAAPAGVAGGGAAATTWDQNGSSMSACSPDASRCIRSGTKMITYWSTVGFNYATADVGNGPYTLTLNYENAGNAPANYAYNVNIYINGQLVAANQKLPVNASGIAPGPYYVNVNVPANPEVRVEWTNDMNLSPAGDANFTLNSLALTK